MASVEAKDYVVFWNFWRWQYLSRNAEYQKEFLKSRKDLEKTTKDLLKAYFRKQTINSDILKSVVNILDDKTYRHFRLNDFLKKAFSLDYDVDSTYFIGRISLLEDSVVEYFQDYFGYPPVDPSKGTNSELILNKLQGGFLDKDIFLPDQLPHCLDFSRIDDSHINYVMCLNKPLDQMLAEIQYLYNSSKQNSFNNKLTTSERDELLNDADNAYYEIAKQILLNKGISFEVKDEPRAIGLWLWDFIKHKYGNKKLPHKAHADTIRLLKEKFSIDRLGYFNSESSVFRNMYHRTEACINSFEVLSMKGESRKKKTKR